MVRCHSPTTNSSLTDPKADPCHSSHWTARSYIGFPSLLSQNPPSLLLLPSAFQYLSCTASAFRDLQMETFTAKTPSALEWPSGFPRCGLPCSPLRFVDPQGQCQCILQWKTPPGNDSYPQGFRLSPSSQLGPCMTTNESQLKTGDISPSCQALGPKTTCMFLCMCWGDSAETSGQTDHHSNFQ